MTTLPVRPMFLIDGYPDGYIEERAWVEVHDKTPTETAALEYLEKQMPIEGIFVDEPENYRYEVTGQAWQRPSGYPIKGYTSLRTEHPIDDYGPCPYCKATGKVEVIDKIEKRNRPSEPVPEATERFIGLQANDWNIERLWNRGFVVTRRADDACPECYGTRHQADFIHADDGESIPWEECSPDALEAMQFWCVEVVERPEDEREPSDEQTTLPGS